MQKEHAAGRTRPPCAGHPPRARADRTTGRARRTDAPGSGETFISSALAYTAKDRRIARFAGPSGRHFDRRDQLRDHRGNRPEDHVERLSALWEAIWLRELPAKLAFTAWRTCRNIASNAEALLFGQPKFFTPRLVPGSGAARGTRRRQLLRHNARLGGPKHALYAHHRRCQVWIDGGDRYLFPTDELGRSRQLVFASDRAGVAERNSRRLSDAVNNEPVNDRETRRAPDLSENGARPDCV
jgi:hypothetical protein